MMMMMMLFRGRLVVLAHKRLHHSTLGKAHTLLHHSNLLQAHKLVRTCMGSNKEEKKNALIFKH